MGAEIRLFEGFTTDPFGIAGRGSDAFKYTISLHSLRLLIDVATHTRNKTLNTTQLVRPWSNAVRCMKDAVARLN